jgi:hypothetical protein
MAKWQTPKFKYLGPAFRNCFPSVAAGAAYIIDSFAAWKFASKESLTIALLFVVREQFFIFLPRFFAFRSPQTKLHLDPVSEENVRFSLDIHKNINMIAAEEKCALCFDIL